MPIDFKPAIKKDATISHLHMPGDKRSLLRGEWFKELVEFIKQSPMITKLDFTRCTEVDTQDLTKLFTRLNQERINIQDINLLGVQLGSQNLKELAESANFPNLTNVLVNDRALSPDILVSVATNFPKMLLTQWQVSP